MPGSNPPGGPGFGVHTAGSAGIIGPLSSEPVAGLLGGADGTLHPPNTAAREKLIMHCACPAVCLFVSAGG